MGHDGREVWAKRVERWVDSGLTAREFAAEIGVNPSTLAHWRWRLSVEGSAQASVRAAPAFVEVVEAPGVVEAGPREAEPLELVLPGGLRVRVPVNFDPSSLKRLVAVLEAR